MHKTSFMASEKSALRPSKEYTNVRRDTQHTHTRTRTTRLKRPQFGVSVHILKLLSSDLRHFESKRMPRANNTHTLFMTLSVIERSPFPKREICSICDKNRTRMSFAHTHTRVMTFLPQQEIPWIAFDSSLEFTVWSSGTCKGTN